MNIAPLTADEIKAIHEATLRILAETGVVMQGDEARALLLDHGAAPNDDRLTLPPELVERCLHQCPPEVTLEGRGGSLVMDRRDLHVHNMGGARDILDAPGGDLRPATTHDLAETTRLLDALPGVTSITPFFTPRDVPPAAMVPAMFDRTVRHTLKPINGPGIQTGEEARLVAEMIAVVFGEKANVSLGVSPVSPLSFHAETSSAIIEVARAGLPFGPLPCPQVGVSAPMTLAGALALQNAEVLASVVLAQLVQPGLPVIYCGRLAVVDMRSVAPIWGNPEIGLISAATVQIAHHYDLPVNVYGLCGSGNAIDIQAGYERAFNALLPALAGADEISGVGEMAGGVFSAHAQMVIDNEIVAMIRRIQRGFAVDADALAEEITRKVMEDGSRMFLAQRHTINHMRAGEVWMRDLGVEALDWDQWVEVGRETVVERAQARATDILATHEVPPLPDNQVRELDRILKTVMES
jgi:trimethylamine--corrinoid protein Co-methyltransferase